MYVIRKKFSELFLYIRERMSIVINHFLNSKSNILLESRLNRYSNTIGFESGKKNQVRALIKIRPTNKGT